MSQGTVKKIVTGKGFGFIEGDNGELFFHSSSVENASFDDIREGQSVEYIEGHGPKGLGGVRELVDTISFVET